MDYRDHRLHLDPAVPVRGSVAAAVTPSPIPPTSATHTNAASTHAPGVRRGVDQRIFSVANPPRASIPATIQNLTTILVSAKPRD